jgi:hypothetical protein
MKTALLLITDHDETGPYVIVDDWRDLTVQISGEFSGTVIIEGTLQADSTVAHWLPIFEMLSSGMVALPGMALAGIRARTEFAASGEVAVYVGGH